MKKISDRGNRTKTTFHYGFGEVQDNVESCMSCVSSQLIFLFKYITSSANFWWVTSIGKEIV